MLCLYCAWVFMHFRDPNGSLSAISNSEYNSVALSHNLLLLLWQSINKVVVVVCVSRGFRKDKFKTVPELYHAVKDS